MDEGGIVGWMDGWRRDEGMGEGEMEGWMIKRWMEGCMDGTSHTKH